MSVALFFAFGLYHIAHFETADEHYWISDRVPQYWQALENGRFKKTLVNDKPGISVALVSGVALPFFENTRYYEQLPQEDNLKKGAIDPQDAEKLFLFFRLPLLIVNTLLLFYFFWAIRKLFQSGFIAAGSVFFIALSPTLIGISQIVNPDALLWSFGFASILSFLLFLKQGSRRNIFLTALFFALALLSKYTAMVLVPLFSIGVIWHAFFGAETTKDVAVTRSRLHTKTIGLGIIFFLSIAITSLLLPAILVKPRYLLDLTLSFSSSMPYVLIGSVALPFIASLFTLSRFISLRPLIDRLFLIKGKLLILVPFTLILFLACIRPLHDMNVFSQVPFDVKNIGTDTIGTTLFEHILLEYNALVFSLQPIVLSLMLFLWGKYLFTQTVSRERFLVVVFLTLPFTLIPFGYLLSGTIATVRYLILLYPLAGLLAALSASEVYEWMRTRFSSSIAVVVLVIGIGSTLVSTLSIAPFYLNYTNFLLPKDKIITDAWGYGGYEAAQYINSLPNAEALTVWSDYAGVCPFLKSTCIIGYKFNERQYHIDYYIISHRGETNIQPDHTKWLKSDRIHPAAIYAEENPAWQLLIDDRPENFVKVVRGE